MAPISMLILNLTRIPWGVFSLLQWAPSKCIYRPGLHKSVTRNDLERNTKPFGEYCRSFKKSSVASKNMLRRGLLDGAGEGFQGEHTGFYSINLENSNKNLHRHRVGAAKIAWIAWIASKVAPSLRRWQYPGRINTALQPDHPRQFAERSHPTLAPSGRVEWRRARLIQVFGRDGVCTG